MPRQERRQIIEIYNALFYIIMGFLFVSSLQQMFRIEPANTIKETKSILKKVGKDREISYKVFINAPRLKILTVNHTGFYDGEI